MQHLEPLVDAAIAALRNGLPARLAAIDPALAAPGEDDYHPGGKPTIAHYPAVEVSAPGGFMENPAIDMADVDAEANVFVVLWVADPDFERLYRSLLRYGRAALECVLQPRVFGGAVVRRAEYSYAANPETRDMQQRIAAAIIRLRIEHFERPNS